MYEKYDIKQMRILVTSSELEFETEEEIREYLRHLLPKKYEGRYWYREKGIKTDDNGDILVLFWYKERAIGCGILYSRKSKKLDVYNGYLQFYPETIFNISGITEDEIHKYSDKPKSVKQGSPKIDIRAKDEILKLVYDRWRDYNC